MRCGNTVLGYKYAYYFGTRWIEVLDARDDRETMEKAGIGNLIFLEQLKLATQEGALVIDSKAGQYEHKRRVGGQTKPIQNFLLVRDSLFHGICLSINRAFVRLFHLLYYKLWYLYLAPKLGMRRKPLWNSWIKTNLFQ